MELSSINPIREAQLAGFDLNLMDINLSLTPAQRIEKHQSALALVVELDTIRKLRDEDAQ